MTRIDELNNQARKTLEKVEQHLDAHSSSMAGTANVAVSLGTALAAGLAIVAKDILPDHPATTVLILLGVAAVSLGVSLLHGILVFDSRSRISEKAVVMWDASKHLTLGVLVEGQGDEAATEAAFLANVGTIAGTLSTTAGEYQDEFKTMASRLTKQIGFLLGSVAVTLIVVFLAYSSADTATVVRWQPTAPVPVSVSGSTTANPKVPVSVVATSTISTATP